MSWLRFLIGIQLIPAAALAQHAGHETGERVETAADVAHEHMARTGVLGLPHARIGSGTSWLPDESPMRAVMATAGAWHVMVHGNVFLGYDYQAGDRGDDKLISPNWIMAMAGRPVGAGHFTARAMLSLEPLTVGKEGYPLLLQTGEAVDGMPIVDRQHPHDLIMEIAATYEHEIASGIAVQLYGGLAGEPALGPVAFPHRPSALADPLAPLSHHWQDSTHIAFGVVTAGVFTRRAKLETSWFNGREPDDERYDLDLRGFDSASARVTVNPSPRWSLQMSGGYLDSPEELEPDTSVVRTTASATYGKRMARGYWSSTLAWGRNTPSEGPTTDNVLAETMIDLGRVGVTFARAEYAMRAGHDLALDVAMEDETFGVGMLSLGHTHPVLREAGLETSLGIRGSAGLLDPDLRSQYGTRYPVGAMVFVQLQPTVMPPP